MSMIFPLLMLSIVAVALYRDYRRDLGQHQTAKVVHATFLALLTFLCVGSLTTLMQVISNFSSTYQTHATLNIVPKDVHGMIVLFRAILGLVFLWWIGRMLRRDSQTKSWLMRLLPLLGLLDGYLFYNNWLLKETEVLYGGGFILLLGMCLYLGTFLIIIRAYQAPFMRRFFARDSMDDKINSIGGSDS